MLHLQDFMLMLKVTRQSLSLFKLNSLIQCTGIIPKILSSFHSSNEPRIILSQLSIYFKRRLNDALNLLYNLRNYDRKEDFR